MKGTPGRLRGVGAYFDILGPRRAVSFVLERDKTTIDEHIGSGTEMKSDRVGQHVVF